MFRICSEDTSSCLCHHLTMTLRPLPRLQLPLAPISRREAGWACSPVPEHPLLPPGSASRVHAAPVPTALLSLCPQILTAAPVPSCRRKPRVPPLQSGSPSAAWGRKETRTAPGRWTRTPRDSWHKGVKQEQCPRRTQSEPWPEPTKLPHSFASSRHRLFNTPSSSSQMCFRPYPC